MSDININNTINEIFEKELNEGVKKENSNISSNMIEDKDQAFNNLINLQLLIQKQSGLKELCK